ncbi:MAG: nucleotidyltransferase [Ignavibacteriae bacterium]|nr:nucleotidyltransferase [Ignavibacteriota bacterium]
MTELQSVLTLLSDHHVDFVVIGGVAATLHGSTYLTYDIDLCYDRKPANIARLASALAPYHPKLRDVAEDVPFVFGEQTIRSGLNFMLSTDLGNVDLFGELPGIGFFEEVSSLAETVELFSRQFLVLTIDGLIAAKKAAGRDKDLLVARELEEIKAKLRGKE